MIAKEDSTIERLRKLVSAIAAVLLVGVAVTTVPSHFETAAAEVMELIGIALLVTAGMGRIWCSIYIAGRKDSQLCTDGPYSLCRNPLYLFSFIGVIGAFIAMQQRELAVIAAMLFLLYYRYVIRSEEARLAELFGPEYAHYQQTTPRFWPRFSNYCSNWNDRRIATKTVERSMREVVWFFAAIILIDVVDAMHRNGILVLAHMPCPFAD